MDQPCSENMCYLASSITNTKLVVDSQCCVAQLLIEEFPITIIINVEMGYYKN